MMTDWKRVYVQGAIDVFHLGSMTEGVTIAIIHTKGYEVFRNSESVGVAETLDGAYEIAEQYVKP